MLRGVLPFKRLICNEREREREREKEVHGGAEEMCVMKSGWALVKFMEWACAEENRKRFIFHFLK